jgi:hypothetical protein
MLLALLVSSYERGMLSSRQIERASYENVAVRPRCADPHPDPDTPCTFRRKNGPLPTKPSNQFWNGPRAPACGQSARSPRHRRPEDPGQRERTVRREQRSRQETRRTLDQETTKLLAKAEQADATPLQDSLAIQAK